jgi:signal transduction histidine kinase
VGLISGILAQSLLRPEVPVLFQLDMGIAAFVFGGVIRQWSFTAFLAGFFITLSLVLLYLWDVRSVRQAKAMILEAMRDLEQNRRSFLRRLDHEIKNPLTGLRAALVNMQETQAAEERQHAVENAGRAVTRLTRLLADLRKLSDLGERPIERTYVDVPDLLQDAVDAAHVLPAFDGREVSLLIPKVPSPFPSITGDRDLLVLAQRILRKCAPRKMVSLLSSKLQIQALASRRRIFPRFSKNYIAARMPAAQRGVG